MSTNPFSLLSLLALIFKNLARRPLRNGLAIGGLGLALGALLCLLGFSKGYEDSLRIEIDQMGMQLMVVPLGCPYDAAARVLKANAIEGSLPQSALAAVVNDPDVAVAAPLLTAAIKRPSEKRADLWVGLDESALLLKPWWKARDGQKWFSNERSVILGADAAVLEMRAAGDKFSEPQSQTTLEVAGTLERSGTSDDQVFFLPLAAAQKMFRQENRLSAIAIRLHDPAKIREVSRRLQAIPGAQIVTVTEMMGSFLNLIGMARGLTLAVAAVGLFAGALMIFNTILAAVLQRARELSLLRAVGASRLQVFFLIEGEAVCFGALASLAGFVMAPLCALGVEPILDRLLPMIPSRNLQSLDGTLLGQALVAGLAIAVAAGIYPAFRACRLAPADSAKN